VARQRAVERRRPRRGADLPRPAGSSTARRSTASPSPPTVSSAASPS
jgi:hypothetical protein